MLFQKVDQRKLDKAEAKLKEKKEKRINTDKKDVQAPIILEMATASQVSVVLKAVCVVKGNVVPCVKWSFKGHSWLPAATDSTALAVVAVFR